MLQITASQWRWGSPQDDVSGLAIYVLTGFSPWRQLLAQIVGNFPVRIPGSRSHPQKPDVKNKAKIYPFTTLARSAALYGSVLQGVIFSGGFVIIVTESKGVGRSQTVGMGSPSPLARLRHD